MDIVKVGTQILIEKLGLSIDPAIVSGALSTLLGGKGKGEGIDLGSIISSMQGNGQLMGLVTSFLGDGANSSMGIDDIVALFGSDKIGSFASSLGVDSNAASKGLADVIPAIIDGSSKGGELLDSLGGAKGVFGALKKFL